MKAIWPNITNTGHLAIIKDLDSFLLVNHNDWSILVLQVILLHQSYQLDDVAYFGDGMRGLDDPNCQLVIVMQRLDGEIPGDCTIKFAVFYQFYFEVVAIERRVLFGRPECLVTLKHAECSVYTRITQE